MRVGSRGVLEDWVAGGLRRKASAGRRIGLEVRDERVVRRRTSCFFSKEKIRLREDPRAISARVLRDVLSLSFFCCQRNRESASSSFSDSDDGFAS